MDVWYTVAKEIVRIYLAFLSDGLQVQGKENLPPGPKIMVANHTAVSDGFYIPFLVPEKVHFLAQSESFTLPILGRLLYLADQIPVVIGRGQEALEEARKRLALGHSVAIFPEAKLSGNKTVHRGGIGAALLSVNSGAPLVPMGVYVEPDHIKEIHAHFYDRPTVGWWQIGGKCVIRNGEPWRPVIETTDRSYRAIREITDKLMARVQELVQQATITKEYS
jgi:1-acyl-sn-glycerol-3-phosphate acyltransferase